MTIGNRQPNNRVASVVADALVSAGLRQVFGVVGNGNVHVVAALVRHGARYTQARHESGAVAMADAYYRVSGEVAVCTTTYGPGFTNMATGLAEAAKIASGLVVICGDAPASGPRPIDIDQPALASVLGCRVVRLTDPATAHAATVEALTWARQRCAPVVLCIPIDLAVAEAETGREQAGKPAQRPARTDTVRLAAAVDVLAAARSPLLLAGLGSWRSGARKAILDLADRVDGLLTTTLLAKGMFAGNPYSLDICGGLATPAAAELISEADVVLAFGTSLSTWTLHGGRLLHPDATLVQVDTAPATSPRVDLALTGDATDIATMLYDGLDARGVEGSGWRARARGSLVGHRWRDHPYLDASTADRIDPRTLCLAIAELLPDDYTLVTDGGHFISWPAMYWPVPDPAAAVYTGIAFQSIGLGFAGAVGAARARPDRMTVLAVGDGGGVMGLADLESLVREVSSCLVVVFNDAEYGAEVHQYGSIGIDVSAARFADVDFVALARSVGARGAVVRTAGDAEVVREWRALGCPGTLVLDCKVAPDVAAAYFVEMTAMPPRADPRRIVEDEPRRGIH